jgi:hypothetical protein
MLQIRAAEKQKEGFRAAGAYKQATPTGFQPLANNENPNRCSQQNPSRMFDSPPK